MKNELFMKPYGLSWAISIMLLCHVDGCTFVYNTATSQGLNECGDGWLTEPVELVEIQTELIQCYDVLMHYVLISEAGRVVNRTDYVVEMCIPLYIPRLPACLPRGHYS